MDPGNPTIRTRLLAALALASLLPACAVAPLQDTPPVPPLQGQPLFPIENVEPLEMSDGMKDFIRTHLSLSLIHI